MIDKSIFLKLIGKLPEKTELNPQIISEVDCGEYIRQLVEYNVEKDERISAYIGIPKQLKSRKTAVFCFHQHASNFEIGKGETFGIVGDTNQAIADELARQGYITFSPDALGFEERTPTKDYKYTVQELLRLGLQGSTLLGKQLHDVHVGIDYLFSRNDMEIEEIAFIGHSFGGRMAFYAPVFDERIKVSISNCGCVNNKNSLKNNTPIQVDFFLFDILKYGDLEDVVKLMSTTPLYISATTDDKYSFGAKALYDEIKDAYSDSNTELKLKIWQGAHIFTKEMRLEAYQFIEKYMK